MTNPTRQQGVTLIEMLVAVTIITLLMAVAMPAFKALNNAFESGESVVRMINTTLSAARATAIQNQKYVGVRFQKTYHTDPLKASQYMILIERDADSTGIQSGYKAVVGVKPIKLPDSVGVMDLMVNQYDSNDLSGAVAMDEVVDVTDPNVNVYLDEPSELLDVTTFSLIFSPQGHLVIRNVVRIRNKDGIADTPSNVNRDSVDTIFNKLSAVQLGQAMFCQDDYYPGYRDPTDQTNENTILGLGPESSRFSLVIYETKPLAQAFQEKLAWTGYLQKYCSRYYVNRYTGALMTAKP